MSGGLNELEWKRIGRGISEARIDVGVDRYRTSLLKIDAGRPVPVHTHEGNEYTLVLSGGFSDASGHYLRGDLSVADPTVEHTPVADTDGPCLCLAVLDAPARFTGPIGRLVNVFARN